MAVATSFTAPNYSGLLYTKTNRRTPFLNSIGAPVISDHVEFAVNQEYDLGTPAQPAISETASLTAPQPTSVARTQATNVCQIFHESVGSSYAHESNMGTLSGINAAGQQPNPNAELAWQIARRMEKIANDINYTFLNGAYNKASSDATINKTRGILAAVTSNAETYTTLSRADIVKILRDVFEKNGVVDGGILTMNAAMKVALTALYEDASGFVLPASRNVGGVAIDQIVTDFGTVGVTIDQMMPANTILFYNPSVVRPVEMYVPGKGNFFYEELSKVGAGTTGQIFGQIGLDYGPEWYHAKLTKSA